MAWQFNNTYCSYREPSFDCQYLPGLQLPEIEASGDQMPFSSRGSCLPMMHVFLCRQDTNTNLKKLEKMFIKQVS